jgi:ubiquinone/menaquinone biosynthesis C-methylase UbiE
MVELGALAVGRAVAISLDQDPARVDKLESMSLADEYERQFAWRDWKAALDLCPVRPGHKILDLGCGPGSLSLELTRRGAEVTGVDQDDALLAVARKRCPNSCKFLSMDLSSIDFQPNTFDGIWSSFTAAYFTDFEKTFRQWTLPLKKSAWVCIVEMDDLLGHSPMPAKFREKINQFYVEAMKEGGYDFQSGRKIRSVVEAAGFEVQERFLSDKELSFNSPAAPEIVRAWSDRFARMPGLKKFLGGDHEEFRASFLDALGNENHRSACRVVCVVGKRV